MIKYSLKALEDLATIKNDLINTDPVAGIVYVSDLVDRIGSIAEEDLKVLDHRGLTCYYSLIKDQAVFLRLEAEDLLVDRIFNRDLDFIKLALDLEK